MDGPEPEREVTDGGPRTRGGKEGRFDDRGPDRARAPLPQPPPPPTEEKGNPRTEYLLRSHLD